ncbi:hypothetical protein J2X19_000293 [Rhodoferax ferrireducens]|uniref:Mandelate racemase n=1 Tax=Rhodoferax ferrireducens TaxID=192843 RepID=A0ABU2C2T8_9BURK|nr:hypothetical protein [Rhodoferax ferrireducens]MDR7375635.1 hypothetical protein [Rhodoferax ferrireducens]
MHASTKAMPVRLRSITLYQRDVTLRLPFRFGAATVTQCPQAFVRLELEVNGRTWEGMAAELMVPKWFDKSPGLTHEQNFEQLRGALRTARAAYLEAGVALTPFALSQTQGEAAIGVAVARGLPRLAAQFGPALLDKAVADAVLRASELDWVRGVAAGVLGDPWSAQLQLQAQGHVWLRHTVGLADRILASDAGASPGDGLPETLEDAIAIYGLRYFKIKLSGQLEADLERLQRIAGLLQRTAGDYRATLDGNETFASAEALGAFWRALQAQAPLQDLLARTLLLEQPLPRHLALVEPIAGLGIDLPVILDESDDQAGVLAQGIALGYRGISSKACKGIYRSLHSAWRVAQEPQRLLLSGEDLTCQAGLAVQQDTLLAASLGVTHIERNGHHYVDGFGTAPAAESDAFAQAHAGFYHAPQGRPRLRVHSGQLQLATLYVPGFATAAAPLWDSLDPIH